jgi:hypothetical protein
LLKSLVAVLPMSVKEYVASLETNAMILGIVALSMKDFATQIIRHVNDDGVLDDAGLAALKATCVRNLKNIAAQGVPLEQEATALNEALIMLGQMMDHAISRGRASRTHRKKSAKFIPVCPA